MNIILTNYNKQLTGENLLARFSYEWVSSLVLSSSVMSWKGTILGFDDTKLYLLVLQTSTEIAKSFTSKDLADTFPRQIASLEYETTFEISTSTEESDVFTGSKKPHVLHAQFDWDHDDVTGHISRDVDSVTQLALSGVIPIDITSADHSLIYSDMFPPTGFVFADELPWGLPSDGMAFVDEKDVGQYTQSQTLFQHRLHMDTGELLTNTQESDLQFTTDNIFPTAEPFFV